MNYPWLEKYLLEKTGAVTDYKAEWGWQRYQVGGKMFAATMHPSAKHQAAYAEKDLINLKCDPLLSPLLQDKHEEILPGFYSDKRNWISVDLNGHLSNEELKGLIDDSYSLIFSKLTKKLQREITQSQI